MKEDTVDSSSVSRMHGFYRWDTHALLSPVSSSSLGTTVLPLHTTSGCGFSPMSPGWFRTIYDDCLLHSSSLTLTMESCLLLPGAQQSISVKSLLHYSFFLSKLTLCSPTTESNSSVAWHSQWPLWQLLEVNGLDDQTHEGERRLHRATVELDLWFTIKIKFAWCPNTFSKSQGEKMAATEFCALFKYTRVREFILRHVFLTDAYAYCFSPLHLHPLAATNSQRLCLLRGLPR